MIKVFEAFAGYGSQRMALRNLGIDHKVVGIAEVDEFALSSYAAIHEEGVEIEDTSEDEMREYLHKLNIPLNDKGKLKNPKGKNLKNVYTASKKARNLGDISKIKAEDIPDHDLFTYSFPCQDISVAGNQKGFSKDSETRSGLLWECERIITEKKPKYLLMENVKNLVSKKFMAGFEEWQDYLASIGYTNYWQVLNAKDFGIPQNRERVFMVSILGEHKPYVFPKPIKLEKRLKDVLEDEVDEKYYLDDERTQQLIATITDVKDIEQQEGLKMNRNEVSGKSDIAQTLLARDYKGFGNQDMNGVVEQVGYVPYKESGKQHQSNTVYNPNKLSPTLVATDYKQPTKILEPKIKQIGNTTPNPKRENPQTGRTYDTDGLAPTLSTMQGGNLQPQIVEPSFAIGSTQKNASVTDGSYSPTLTSSMGTGGGHVPMIDEPKIAASRGRNPENSSDRTKGAPTEQRLEVNDRGTTNALTTQGDLIAKEEFGRMGEQAVRTQNKLSLPHGETLNPWNEEQSSTNGVAPTLTTRPEGFKTAINVTDKYRIRKLTPLECWRLMDVTDEDFYKAQAVNSNSQLYKQAGNSIVVSVLEAIFRNMFLEVPGEDLIGEQILWEEFTGTVNE